MKSAIAGLMIIGDTQGNHLWEFGGKLALRQLSGSKENYSASPNGVLMMDVTIKCTVPGCRCECFMPGKIKIRQCENCCHGWVIHALDKLGFQHLCNRNQVDAVQTNIVFDVASLILYGCQAIPMRIKILLDRLLSLLPHEEVLLILHSFGWTYEDYARGYILQDIEGIVLDKWTICTREEETLILQQFFRFEETRNLTRDMLLCDAGKEVSSVEAKSDKGSESDIKKFIEMASKISSCLLSKNENKYSSLPSFPSEMITENSITVDTGCYKSKFQTSDSSKEQNKQEKFNILSLIGLPKEITPNSNSKSLNGLNRSDIPSISSHSSSPITDDCSDEDSSYNDIVLNLSHDTSSAPDYPDKKDKHVRKSINPTKRRWNPINLGTQLINPLTGKKRVQCNVCLKTFCDKGALKIHFSAVHLKEMHRCTVHGCNMMFSSRRSRNRHSANPNPKLHTPHMRRKISPHDGRTSQPHHLVFKNPLISSSSINSPLSSNGLSDPLPSSLSQNSAFGFPFIPRSLEELNKSYDELETTLDLRVEKNKNKSTDNIDQNQLSVNEKDCSEKDLQSHMPSESGPDEDEDVLSTLSTHSIKEETLMESRARLRKSQNPTRYSVPNEMEDEEESDDPGFIVNNDDYENDDEFPIYVQKTEDDISMKCKKVSDKDEKVFEDAILLEEQRNSIGCVEELEKEKIDSKNIESLSALEQKVAPSENGMIFSQIEENTSSLESSEQRPNKVSSSLKHLEYLSKGNFGDLLSNNFISQHATFNKIFPHVSYGFMENLGVNSQSFHNSNYETSEFDKNVSNPPSPSSSIGSAQNIGYKNSIINTALDIPVDKENPRRCIACGKLFQNHFGVKTHYQNVHLKLMHKCTVDGCNAAFPSKRSRDRHSANLNLHRKLLSTCSDKSIPYLNSFERSNLITSMALQGGKSFSGNHYNNFYADGRNLGIVPFASQNLLEKDSFLHHHSVISPFPFLLHSSCLPHDFPYRSFAPHDYLDDAKLISDKHLEAFSRFPNSVPVYDIDEDCPTPDHDGKFPCKFCHKTFMSRSVLKEHYLSLHLPEMHKCSVNGCNKIFASRKRRNVHCQNDSIHDFLRSVPSSQKIYAPSAEPNQISKECTVTS